MEEKIMKPLSMARRDFAAGLTELINNSGLPMFVVEDTMREFMHKVVAIAEEQLRREEEAYKQSVGNPGEEHVIITKRGE